MKIKRFYAFMRKREAIRQAREEGKPWPWTTDKILQQYKFTNVKREHDKTTRIFREEFYEPNRKAFLHVILYNAAMARYFGTVEWMRVAGWQSEHNPELLIKKAAAEIQKGNKIFTGAYMVTNCGRKGAKHELVVNEFLAPLWISAGFLAEIAYKTQSWEALINEMRKYEGFGGSGFMAKEVVLDTLFCNFWKAGKPVDFDTWCPLGPGARRGLNRLKGLPKDKPTKEEEGIKDMLEIFDKRKDFWPKEYPELVLHDIQFQLCEYDKYERVLNNEGRPRSLYKKPEIIL